MLTPEQYQALKDRHAKFEAWRNGRTSYESGSVPLDIRISNDELSSMELYEFVTNPPERYFLYIKRPTPPAGCTLGFQRTIATTWTGEKLGDVISGSQYRSNFGDRRVPITVHAVNGKTYHGTYYCDAGDYARIRMAKQKTA